MREHSRDHGRLEEILKYALNVEQIVGDTDFDKFVSDIRIYYSVMKNVEVIGEAANMLTRHFREVHNELPWRQIISLRNVLVHSYAQVSDADLWHTATNDIRPLREQVQRYLAEIDWNSWAQSEEPYTEMDNAVYKKTIETARNLKRMGLTDQQIAEATGLTTKEIESL